MASLRARTRGPIGIGGSITSAVTISLYVITYIRTGIACGAMGTSFVMPDVLVLAGGGIVGDAWMQGVLAGIEDGAAVDLREVESFVGTSAGAIVAARLAAGRRPRRPDADHPTAAAEGFEEDLEETLPPAAGPLRGVLRGLGHVGWAAAAPMAGLAMSVGGPLGALTRGTLLSHAPENGRSLEHLRAGVDRWGSAFDGRLRICAVDRQSGRRVVFGRPGAPDATVAQAVCASCAIPWYFAPIRIGARTYVDGGAYSVTNLDAARAGRGTRVLCLDPIAALTSEEPRMVALRAAFRLATEIELSGLRRRGAEVQHVVPDARAARAIGPNLMAPGPAAAASASGYRQGLALAA
jgi:NTE family protein